MKRCLQLIFGFVFAAAPASAQEPYSTVSTGISIGYDVARGEFQNAWSGSPLPVLSKRENELVLGAKSSLVFALSRHFEFEAGLMEIRVFTSRPIDFIVPTGGLRYRLTTSSRLRELMR